MRFAVPQMYNHATDTIVVDGQIYTRVQVIIDICKAADGVIEVAKGNTTDRDLLLQAEGMLEFSRELRLQLLKL